VKQPSPLLGFNNNVRHKGRVFHIQTEDSGIKHPHIITHLFADGGRILKTTKTSYAEHVGTETISETVRHLMQEQHKAMFIALRDGQFDHLLEELPPAPPGATAANPAGSARAKQIADGAPARAPAVAASPPAAPPPPAAVPAQGPAARPASTRPTQRASPVPSKGRKSNSRPKLELDPAALLPPEHRPVSPTAMTVMANAPTEPPLSPPPDVDVDLDAIERAAAEANRPFFQQINDLPPPPAAVLGKKSSDVPPRDTSYRGVTTGTQHVVEPPPAPPPAGATKSPISAPTTGRYAPARTAPIFNPRPASEASIFGEDLISEKSLDEVILSYLAEDLDAPSEKK
jgi:hypothetical protein